MGVFGAFFGCRGDAGFSSPLLGASRGVVGFNVAMLLRLVREKVRPAWPDGGREREKVRPVHEKSPTIGVFRRAGRVFSRKSRWRGCAGRVFSRKCGWRGCAGRIFSRKSHWRGCAGRVFSRSSSRVILLGELCRAVALVAGPSTGSANPLMRGYTLWVAWWAARPAHHPSG